MKKLIRVFTILCAIGICVFACALDSTEHFGFILTALIFCFLWVIGYGHIQMFRGE